MWLYTRYGFVSVVEHMSDEAKLWVRARKEHHLKNVLKHYLPDSDFHDQVQCTTGAGYDYGYRVKMDRKSFARLVDTAVSGIDYPNFKDACHESGDSAYDECLGQTWLEARNMQRSKF